MVPQNICSVVRKQVRSMKLPEKAFIMLYNASAHLEEFVSDDDNGNLPVT